MPAPLAFIANSLCGDSGDPLDLCGAGTTVSSYALPTFQLGFTTPALTFNTTTTIIGASGMLYQNQLIYIPGLGCMTVVSVTGDSVILRNDTVTPGTVIVAGTAFQAGIPGDCFTVQISAAQLSELLCDSDCPPQDYEAGGILACSDKGIVALKSAAPGIWTHGADGALRFVTVGNDQHLVYDAGSGFFVAENNVVLPTNRLYAGCYAGDYETDGSDQASVVSAWSTKVNNTGFTQVGDTITLPEAGDYKITLSTGVANNAANTNTGNIYFGLFRSGALVDNYRLTGNVSPNDAGSGHVEWVATFAASQTVRIRGRILSSPGLVPQGAFRVLDPCLFIEKL